MKQLKLDLIAHLSAYVTENRLELFKQILAERTRYLTVIMEDIYQSQNASAVLRSCECLGIQDVHIVEGRNEYQINREVALGSDRWLSLHYFREDGDNISKAIDTLKSSGYRIVATSPHKAGTTPESFSLEEGKAAILFGTELNGLTRRALELSDEYIQIPMAGFTESYNISVSAAIVLYSLRKRLEGSALPWRLGDEERQELLLNWLRTSIRRSDRIENKFIKNYKTDF